MIKTWFKQVIFCDVCDAVFHRQWEETGEDDETGYFKLPEGWGAIGQPNDEETHRCPLCRMQSSSKVGG